MEMTPMPRAQHDYDDIPGTFVFDAERSRQGYGINMFCMSLMKDENRKAFKANEAEYLKKFPLTPEQATAILNREYNRLLELGGNIYFTAKLGATDGHSFRHLAATMTGASQEERRRTCRRSARRSTTSRPGNPIGSGCSPASRSRNNGWRRPGPTSPSWSTTITPPPSRSSSYRPSKSA